MPLRFTHTMHIHTHARTHARTHTHTPHTHHTHTHTHHTTHTHTHTSQWFIYIRSMALPLVPSAGVTLKELCLNKCFWLQRSVKSVLAVITLWGCLYEQSAFPVHVPKPVCLQNETSLGCLNGSKTTIIQFMAVSQAYGPTKAFICTNELSYLYVSSVLLQNIHIQTL